MKMLNVIPVATIVLSCTMIALPVSSAEGRGSAQGGGGGSGVAGFSGGGGRAGGGGGIASRSAAMASRGAFVGNRGAVMGNRAAVAGSRGVISGNRGAVVGGGRAFTANQGTFATGNRIAVRRAQTVTPAAVGMVGGQLASQGVSNQAFQSDRRFDRRADRRSDRFDRRSDRRGHRFDRGFSRRAIPVYYYGFNFYPSYGFDINDFSPVTVDANGNPFDRRFVNSQQAVRVPGAILPIAGGPRTVEVQLALRNRGFYGGPIDGVIGSQSRGAIRAFQYAYGLPVTGGIDSRMFTVLMRGF